MPAGGSFMGTIKVYNTVRLKEAQEASLEILLEVDRICRANGIKYLMDAGTLLGAVRHRGFIPWDDDVDIAMTRENFDRFFKVVRDDAGSVQDGLPDTMQLVMPDEYRGGEAFYDFTPRIIYLNSRRRAETPETEFYEGKLNHLWVDIFILDNIPDNGIADAWTRFRQKMIYGYAMSHRFQLDMDKYSPSDRRKVGMLVRRGRNKDMKELFREQEELSRKYNDRRTGRMYYSNYQPDYMQDTVEREWSEQTTELEFEGYMLMAPAEYDKVLRVIYGDYTVLPPEDQRVPSHSDEIEVYKDGRPQEPIVR